MLEDPFCMARRACSTVSAPIRKDAPFLLPVGIYRPTLVAENDVDRQAREKKVYPGGKTRSLISPVAVYLVQCYNTNTLVIPQQPQDARAGPWNSENDLMSLGRLNANLVELFGGLRY